MYMDSDGNAMGVVLTNKLWRLIPEPSVQLYTYLYTDNLKRRFPVQNVSYVDYFKRRNINDVLLKKISSFEDREKNWYKTGIWVENPYYEERPKWSSEDFWTSRGEKYFCSGCGDYSDKKLTHCPHCGRRLEKTEVDTTIKSNWSNRRVELRIEY